MTARPPLRTVAARGGELLFVALATASTTLGPVYQFRLRWPVTVNPADDAAVVTWLVLVHAVALGFVAARWSRGLAARVAPVGLVAVAVLGVVLVASTAWSYTPARTAAAALQVAATVATGLYLVGAVGHRCRVAGMLVGLHAGLLWSAWRIRDHAPGALDEVGNWTGVYFNRNSLAPVAALGVICCAVAVVGVRELAGGRVARGVIVIAALGLAVLDVRLYVGTGSRTAAVATGVAVAVVGALVAVRDRLPRGWTVRRVQVVSGGVLLGAAAAVAVARDVLIAPFTSSDLTGRTAVWGVVLDWWSRRPLHGWGFLGLWGRNVEFTQDQYAVNDGAAASSAHNSLLDVLLGAGIVAAAAYVGIVVVAWLAVSRTVLTARGVLVLAVPLAWVFCLVLSTVETFIVGHHLFWALLVGAIAVPVGVPTEAQGAGEPRIATPAC